MDSIAIHCKPSFCVEREYIYDIIFGYFWDIRYSIFYEERRDVVLSLGGTSITLSDRFFQQDASIWLTRASLPKRPLRQLKVPEEFRTAVIDEQMPVIYGDEGASEMFSDSRDYCSIDVFGASFFMLSRYEELIAPERDTFGRFPAKASLAFQENFLLRPIINEYLELLWYWMRKFWPRLQRRERMFTIMPTHDCDTPFRSFGETRWRRCRSLIGDVVKRHSLTLLLRNIQIYSETEKGNYTNDPYNTFADIMNISEENNLLSTFFFMTSNGRHELDGKYDIEALPIVQLLREIYRRGHHIGIHPGFGSCDKEDWIKADLERLRWILMREKIDGSKIGGRQHYLSWRVPETWRYYEKAGIAYDMTLSYADHIGFRCGVCYEYPAYDLVKRRRYRLQQYPLEVMECSGLDYMHLTVDEMLRKCNEIKANVKKYKGLFILLWHNSRLVDPREKELYKRILSE